jgi:hypothetical protein
MGITTASRRTALLSLASGANPRPAIVAVLLKWPPSGCSWHEGRTDLDLAEFVEETLSEILKGIRAAQKKKGGEAVGAAGVSASAWSPTHPNPTLLVPGLGDATFTVVEFDVSVLAETSAGGRGRLKVWSVGSIEAGGKRSDQHTSRVRFAVQLKIPPGDKAERPPGF